MELSAGLVRSSSASTGRGRSQHSVSHMRGGHSGRTCLYVKSTPLPRHASTGDSIALLSSTPTPPSPATPSSAAPSAAGITNTAGARLRSLLRVNSAPPAPGVPQLRSLLTDWSVDSRSYQRRGCLYTSPLASLAEPTLALPLPGLGAGEWLPAAPVAAPAAAAGEGDDPGMG